MLCVLLSSSLQAFAQDIRVLERSRPPTVDGVLQEREWPGQPLLIDRQEQVWSEDAWGGAKDLSAKIHLAYDASHLYVAGQVWDNSFRAGQVGTAWHRQDALELFLDTSPEPNAERLEFGSEDLQFFIMPFNPERPWGVMGSREDSSGRTEARPGGEIYTGVRVAHQLHPDASYSFEAVIPFHNLEGFEAGTAVMGFNLALDDFDAGTERYQYMTWNGEGPTSGGRLSRMRFVGVPPLSDLAEDSSGWMNWLGAAAPKLLLPLLGLLLSVLLIRLWVQASRRRPALRSLGWSLGVLLFVAGLLLPGWLSDSRIEGFDAGVDSVASALSREIERMEDSALGSYRGATRDQPLMDLLVGGTITGEREFSHRILDEVSGGPLLRPRVLGGFQIRPYWVPLIQAQAERFNFRKPLEEGQVNLVLARPQPERLSFQALGSLPVVLELGLREAEEGPIQETRDLEFRGPFYQVNEFTQARMEATFETIAIGKGLRSLSLSSRSESELYLVGMTWVSRDGSREMPLYLGEDSLGGVETGLRGPLPSNAGFLLAPGDRREIKFDAANRAGAEKLWLFFHGDHGGRTIPDLDRGDLVCQVDLRFADEAQEVMQLDFQHQSSMFFEQHRFNQFLAGESEVAIAYQWEDGEQETHISLVREIELPAAAGLASLEFRNTGPYPIRFRAAVFGSEVREVATSIADGPMVRRGPLGQEGLRPELFQSLGDASFAIYRGGRLTASTFALAEGSELSTISTAIERELAAGEVAEQRRFEGEDSLRYERYLLLSGEGWSGEVLGVFLRDPDNRSYFEEVEMIGLLLCLAASPVLLLLVSEILALVKSLRLRLITVLSVATLAPLGILSFVLFTVLETGHEDEQRGGLEQAMASVNARLAERKALQKQTANRWLKDLVAAFPERNEINDLNRDVDEALRSVMHSQLPPEWEEDGGYLSFEFVPAAGETGPPGSFSIFVGSEGMRYLDSPLREDPSLTLSWGVPVLGVQSTASLPGGGECYLTVGRRMDETFLAGLAPDRSLILCDARGYPLSAAQGDSAGVSNQLSNSLRPGLCADRRGAWEAVLESGGPSITRHSYANQDWIAVYDLLRDDQETPRMLLGMIESDRPAELPLQLGAIPVSDFFISAAGILLLLSLFLGFVVTYRISKPIEKLEKGALALSRGEFDVSVESNEGGQIGRLTRAFNQMSQDLRGRIQDLRSLNRGIRDLSSKLELDDVLVAARELFAEHSQAERVMILLSDREGEQLRLFGEEREQVDRHDQLARTMLAAGGPFSMRLMGGEGLPGLLGEQGSVLGLPLLLGNRCHGTLLLLSASPSPPQTNLDLAWALAAQTAAVMENARLYQHAVEDRHSGALLPEYFQRCLAAEVSSAQVSAGELSLLGLRIIEGRELTQQLGAENHARLLEALVSALREHLGSEAMICRVDDASLQILLPAVGVQEGERVLGDCLQVLSAMDFGYKSRLRFVGGIASYPVDGASAEFLSDCMATRMAGGPSRKVSVHERRQHLATEGVFMDSPAMEAVLNSLERLAPTDITILLEGETGTGKEVITNLIHRMSKRASGPLIKVHCAALPENLLQSELFGHERGAFTGAVASKIGRFEQASGGTIFLDEIGEISLEVQVKLLRVLQEREIDRVGGTQPIPVDVRVIAATNQDIQRMVADGRFREDLYYRLQGMVVRVPPLRERKQEIPGLVEQFRRDAVAAGQSHAEGFSTDVLDELFRRDWPGNVRELRNEVFRALVLAQGALVTANDLAGVLGSPAGESRLDPRPDEEPSYSIPTQAAVEDSPPAPEGLSPRLRMLYNLVRERGSISTQDCSKVCGVSQRTALRDLTNMQEQGLLSRKGKRRGARYFIAPGPADLASS